jgi:hypothetical protein
VHSAGRATPLPGLASRPDRIGDRAPGNAGAITTVPMPAGMARATQARGDRATPVMPG